MYVYLHTKRIILICIFSWCQPYYGILLPVLFAFHVIQLLLMSITDILCELLKSEASVIVSE